MNSMSGITSKDLISKVKEIGQKLDNLNVRIAEYEQWLRVTQHGGLPVSAWVMLNPRTDLGVSNIDRVPRVVIRQNDQFDKITPLVNTEVQLRVTAVSKLEDLTNALFAALDLQSQEITHATQNLDTLISRLVGKP